MSLQEWFQKLGDVTSLFIKHDTQQIDVAPLKLFFDFSDRALLRAFGFHDQDHAIDLTGEEERFRVAVERRAVQDDVSRTFLAARSKEL